MSYSTISYENTVHGVASEMKVLLLNTSDCVGGAAIAAQRLNSGLRSAGVDSRMLVQHKTSDLGSVVGPSSGLDKALSVLRSPLTRRLLNLRAGIDTGNFSPEWFPSHALKTIETINPDIVHLHYLGRGFGRPEIIGNIKRPIIWTLHDMWPFTGGCHYDKECGRYRDSCGKCPVLGSSKEKDLSRKVWRRKQAAWGEAKVTIVTLSNWMERCVGESTIFQNATTYRVPNGLDLDLFRPIEPAVARSILGFPVDKLLVLFGTVTAGSKEYKGFEHLEEMLTGAVEIGTEVEAVVFGGSEPSDPPDFGFPTTYMGRLHDTNSLVLLYSAVDVFIAPSRQDNLPNTVMEALACGTPCLAFNIGGMPDLIDHKKNGYLATPFDTADMAAGLNWILADSDRRRRLSENARKKVERCFSQRLQVERMMEIYESVA